MFFPYYPQQQNRFAQFYMLMNQFLLVGLGLAHSSTNPYVIYVLVAVVLAVLVYNRQALMAIKINLALTFRPRPKHRLVE